MAFDSNAAPAVDGEADDYAACGPCILELAPTLLREAPNESRADRDFTLALASSVASADGAAFEELTNAPGYARQPIRFTRISNDKHGIALQNAQAIEFGPVSHAWPPIAYGVLLDERGIIIAYGRLERTGGRARPSVVFAPGWIRLRRYHRRNG